MKRRVLCHRKFFALFLDKNSKFFCEEKIAGVESDSN